MMQATETQIADSRVVNAPRELVFAMFTDAEHITHWWGPRGFSTRTKQMDVQPGGMWLHTMIGPDGTEYPNEVRYLEVESPSRLVWDHVNYPTFRTTVDFVEMDGGRTEIRCRMDFPDKELRDEVAAAHGAVEGLRDTLARLEEVLATKDGEVLTIVREFDAPRELVFAAWTEPERLQHWFGPVGCSMTVRRADIRTGGEMVYGMPAPDGSMMWGRWHFRDVTPPERIVLVLSFLDDQENAIPHPFVPTMPVEMLSTTTFAEKDGCTVMTLRSQAMYASEESRQTFFKMFAGMETGWRGTLDKLEAYLKTV